MVRTSIGIVGREIEQGHSRSPTNANRQGIEEVAETEPALVVMAGGSHLSQ